MWFVLSFTHTPHTLTGFTALHNGKMYFSSRDVCRILAVSNPDLLAWRLGDCLAHEVTADCFFLDDDDQLAYLLSPNAWVTHYHHLVHFLGCYILADDEGSSSSSSAFPEAEKRMLHHFLRRGCVSLVSVQHHVTYLREDPGSPVTFVTWMLDQRQRRRWQLLLLQNSN